MSSAAFTTSANATPSPGSRSNTIRSGCSGSASVAPQACSSIAEICAMAISPSASSIARNGWPSASPCANRRRQCTATVLLKEVLAADPFRAAHHRERAARNAGQRVIGDRTPVFRQILLGDSRPQLAIGMRQLNIAHGHTASLGCARRHDGAVATRRHAHHRSAPCRRGRIARPRPDRLALCLGIRRFTHHLRRGLVLAKTEIRRVTHPARSRPCGELHLGDQFRPHPVYGARQRIACNEQRLRRVGCEFGQTSAELRKYVAPRNPCPRRRRSAARPADHNNPGAASPIPCGCRQAASTPARSSSSRPRHFTFTQP